MSRTKAINLFHENTQIKLERSKASCAFGMSKMTVPNENEDGPIEYN